MGKIKGLENLKDMDYPGRAIILGNTINRDPFSVYILTGRSESSKARTLERDERNGVVYTKPTDRKKLEEGSPVLLLYPAIMNFRRGLAVSNGAQTKLIYNYCRNDESEWKLKPYGVLVQSLENSFLEYDEKLDFIDITSYEPDSNHTPRISGCIENHIENGFALSIAKITGKEYFHSPRKISPGYGEFIATYDGRDTGTQPLHAFKGNPLEVRLQGRTPKEIANEVRSALKDEYFIALACSLIYCDGPYAYIINSD